MVDAGPKHLNRFESSTAVEPEVPSKIGAKFLLWDLLEITSVVVDYVGVALAVSELSAEPDAVIYVVEQPVAQALLQAGDKNLRVSVRVPKPYRVTEIRLHPFVIEDMQNMYAVLANVFDGFALLRILCALQPYAVLRQH